MQKPKDFPTKTVRTNYVDSGRAGLQYQKASWRRWASTYVPGLGYAPTLTSPEKSELRSAENEPLISDPKPIVF